MKQVWEVLFHIKGINWTFENFFFDQTIVLWYLEASHEVDWLHSKNHIWSGIGPQQCESCNHL